MATLAQLDLAGQMVIAVYQGDASASSGGVLGPSVVIDGANPMPDVGWTTPDGGATWVAPAAGNPVANQAALLHKATLALQINATYLALNPPTQAQVVAQVAALTKEVNALLKLALGQFGDTTGT
jgi:hypothetical protein